MKKYLLNSIVVTCAALSLAGCFGSSKGNRPEPEPLPVVTPLLTTTQVWSTRVGDVDFPLVPRVVGTQIALAGGDGTVLMLNASTGQVIWQASAGARLTAGVGSNGRYTAVVTRDNDLVVFDERGQELWRKRVAAQVLTPPLVAGGRVFVNATDRSIQAYDVRNGAGLWRQQQNTNDSLVLRRDGALDAYGNILIVGLTANLYGVSPDTGAPLWGLPIGNPRGTNEIDRLADVVGGVARNGDVLCARSYQNAIACIQAGGAVLWSKSADSDQGLAVDSQNVYAVESDGRIMALNQQTGAAVWNNDQLRYRQLTAPLALGQRSVVIGDSQGNIHLLSRQDGSFLGRFTTNSSGVAVTPVAVGDMLIIVTRNGTVYGFRPG